MANGEENIHQHAAVQLLPNVYSHRYIALMQDVKNCKIANKQ